MTMGAHKTYSREKMLEIGAAVAKTAGIKGAMKELIRKHDISDATAYKYRNLYLASVANGPPPSGNGNSLPGNGQAADCARHAMDCLAMIQPFIADHFQSGGQDLVYGNAQSAYLWLLRAQGANQ